MNAAHHAAESPPRRLDRGVTPRLPSRLRRWLAWAAGFVACAGIIGGGHLLWKSQRCRELERDCRRARDAGDWNAVARLSAIWAGIAPEDADPWLYNAQAAMTQNRLADADAALAHLPDGDPKTIPGLLERVDLLFGELAQPFEAVRTCERILALDPRTGAAHQRLTFFYAVTLQRIRLIEQARRTIAAGCDIPETYVYLIGADWITLSNTQSINQQWLARDPDNELFLVAIARGYMSNRGLDDTEVDEADAPDDEATPAVPEHERRLAEYLERFPANLELLAYFLQKATTKGDAERVVALLAQAPPEAELDNRFWRYKGWLHSIRGESAEAEAAFREALRLHPFDWATQHQMAGILRKKGQRSDASRMATLAEAGRQLRKTILSQPDVRSIPPAVLGEMAAYAANCGDDEVAGRLASRVERRRPGPATVAPGR